MVSIVYHIKLTHSPQMLCKKTLYDLAKSSFETYLQYNDIELAFEELMYYRKVKEYNICNQCFDEFWRSAHWLFKMLDNRGILAVYFGDFDIPFPDFVPLPN